MAVRFEMDRIYRMRTLLCLALLLAPACDTTSQSTRPATAMSDEMRVVPLKYAPAQEIADELNQLIVLGRDPSSTEKPVHAIVADTRTNSLLVKAPNADMPRILDLIEKLDKKVESTAK